VETLRPLPSDTLIIWRAIYRTFWTQPEKEVEECLTVMHFPGPHRKRLRTTKGLERLNREIGGQTWPASSPARGVPTSGDRPGRGDE